MNILILNDDEKSQKDTINTQLFLFAVKYIQKKDVSHFSSHHFLETNNRAINKK
jgi:hypothetical protein